MLEKIRDFMDTKVEMVILIDIIEDFSVLATVMKAIGLNRLSYEPYKVHVDDIANYMLELRIPYNRYLIMMKKLQKLGYNLKSESEVDIINRLIKIES